MKIKLNVPLRGHKKGEVLEVSVHDVYWRARIRDSRLDHCVDVVHAKSVSAGSEQKTKGVK